MSLNPAIAVCWMNSRFWKKKKYFIIVMFKI